MPPRSIEFVSDPFCWFDDTYESPTAEGNTKEDLWCITTRVIRSIFENYLAPDRGNPTYTSFESGPHWRITLVSGVILCQLSEENMLSKSIKNHPIVVGEYDQWLVSNSGSKEDLKAKTLTGNLKDYVGDPSATSSFTTKSTRKINMMFAAVNNAADQVKRNFSALKKWHSSEDTGVHDRCFHDWRDVLEETEGWDTMGVSEGGGKT